MPQVTHRDGSCRAPVIGMIMRLSSSLCGLWPVGSSDEGGLLCDPQLEVGCLPRHSSAHSARCSLWACCQAQEHQNMGQPSFMAELRQHLVMATMSRLCSASTSLCRRCWNICRAASMSCPVSSITCKTCYFCDKACMASSAALKPGGTCPIRHDHDSQRGAACTPCVCGFPDHLGCIRP